MMNGFYNHYETFPCIFKRHLTRFVYESEKEVRQHAKDNGYKNPKIELKQITKIGWFSYFLLWRVEF